MHGILFPEKSSQLFPGYVVLGSNLTSASPDCTLEKGDQDKPTAFNGHSLKCRSLSIAPASKKVSFTHAFFFFFFLLM